MFTLHASKKSCILCFTYAHCPIFLHNHNCFLSLLSWLLTLLCKMLLFAYDWKWKICFALDFKIHGLKVKACFLFCLFQETNKLRDIIAVILFLFPLINIHIQTTSNCNICLFNEKRIMFHIKINIKGHHF